MTKPFTVNVARFDPYKLFAFLIYFDTSTSPVAGVSKVSAIKRSSDVIEYKEGGNAITRKGPGRTKYEPITLERGVTHDDSFEAWANAAQVLDKGSPSSSLLVLRREVRVELMNEDHQRCTAGSSTAAGFRSSRPCPISTPARMRSPSSTSSSRTKAGSTTCH